MADIQCGLVELRPRRGGGFFWGHIYIGHVVGGQLGAAPNCMRFLLQCLALQYEIFPSF